MSLPPDAAGTVDRAFALLQDLLPQHLLSRAMHRVARSETRWVRDAILRFVLRAYPQINLDEAANPDPFAYPSFNAFFTRALKPGARPLAGGERDLVSPVDGTLSQLGTVSSGQLLQAKGMHYTAAALLADAAAARHYEGGGFACIYLAPYNYHRIHMPLAGRLTATRYVPGRLYSVNAGTARIVPELFARNERVVLISDQLKVNDRWANMLGFSQEELRAQLSHWRDLIHPDDLDRVVDAYDQHAEGSQAIIPDRISNAVENGRMGLGVRQRANRQTGFKRESHPCFRNAHRYQ